ncbi:regulator [Agreia pratensis]|uniref:AAA family ATPase n=1 Tax=Agreia pratensis TaxID=150121 RepID=UPI00188B9F65|nr:regulator [Agreia pratensis]MBF4633365.1 regulator [Agreia pratensis]
MLTVITCLADAADERLMREIRSTDHDVAARVGSAHEVIDAIRGRAVDGVIVSATRRHLSLDVLAEADEAGVRIVAVADGDAERRYALSLGLFEVVDVHTPWSDIEGLLRGGIAVPHSAAPPRGAGTVIAVWGPAGSPGRTTIAIQLASELALRGRTVALVDADTYGGAVAPSLGMLDESPSFAAACRLASRDSLTLAELERVASRYTSPRSEFWILSGIGRASRWPELGTDRVASVLSTCRQWVDYVVVDTGFNLETDEEIASDMFAPRRNAATLAALRQADHVVAVGSADPIGLSRFLRAHVDLLEQVETAQISVVINRLRASSVGSNAQHQVQKTLRRFGGLDNAVFVPLDVPGVDSAVLSGKTIHDAAPRSPVRSAIAHLVDVDILPPSAQATSRKQTRRAARQGAKTGPLQTLRARRLG